ncbi:hypothetical protein ACS3SW_11575 [Roseobacteraceae bacterium S113]
MNLATGPFRTGSLALVISAVLHFLAPFTGGFNGQTLALVCVGAVYVALAYGLARGWRWLAYISFLVLFAGMIGAIASIWGGPAPGWLFAAMVVVNFGGIVALFVALWSAPQERTT